MADLSKQNTALHGCQLIALEHRNKRQTLPRKIRVGGFDQQVGHLPLDRLFIGTVASAMVRPDHAPDPGKGKIRFGRQRRKL